MQLIEQGKVTLDTPVASILPELSNPVVLDRSSGELEVKPAVNVMTVEHLLNHTSGLFYEPSDVPFPATYSAKHSKDDPIGNFFGLTKVC